MSVRRNTLEPDAMSAIVNCLCPECGGVIELETNQLECLRCGKHWRQGWERMSPQPFCPVEHRRKFIGTKRFGMGEKISSLTSKSHFLLPWASEPFLRCSSAQRCLRAIRRCDAAQQSPLGDYAAYDEKSTD